jgi:hypothetical protein
MFHSGFLAAVPLSLMIECATGFDIILHYEEESRPSFDPDGSKLKAVFQAAEAIWEDILEGGGTQVVDYSWGPNDAFGTTIQPTIFSVADITMSDADIWYIDPTSLDHSEYDFGGTGASPEFYGQSLYRDLNAENQDRWFDGIPPGLLEVVVVQVKPDI